MNTSLGVLTLTGVLECVWQKTSTLSIAWPGLTLHRPTFSVWFSCPTGWVVSTDFTTSSADRLASKCFGSSFYCPSAAWRQRHFNFSNVYTCFQRKYSNNSQCPTGALLTMPITSAFLVNTSPGGLLLQSSSLCSAFHFHSHFHFLIVITDWFPSQISTPVFTRTTVAGGALWISFVGFSLQLCTPGWTIQRYPTLPWSLQPSFFSFFKRWWGRLLLQRPTMLSYFCSFLSPWSLSWALLIQHGWNPLP